MVRDGGVYYIAVCAGSLANTLSFFLFSQAFHGTFTSLAGCIAVIISSRIIINFRIAAEKRRVSNEIERPWDDTIVSNPDAIELTMWSDIISFNRGISWATMTGRRDPETG
ncbi:hypothetical protein VKT23_005931 [Stygiomarasmius scandens]|uniref:GtrA-like protein domain-containing protein n=1 Tax=Marasmiellus scandens TaxID=2682957 RepID=A0ABR1JQ69_9AGAR